MNNHMILYAAELQRRLKNAAETIAAYDPKHSGSDNIRFDWEAFDDDDLIHLSIYSYDRYNNSCSCHPEWEICEAETSHHIPTDQIAPADPLIEIDYSWDFGQTQFFKEFKAQIEAEKEAEKQRLAQEARDRIAAEARAKEMRERAELERLNKLYGKN